MNTAAISSARKDNGESPSKKIHKRKGCRSSQEFGDKEEDAMPKKTAKHNGSQIRLNFPPFRFHDGIFPTFAPQIIGPQIQVRNKAMQNKSTIRRCAYSAYIRIDCGTTGLRDTESRSLEVPKPRSPQIIVI